MWKRIFLVATILVIAGCYSVQPLNTVIIPTKPKHSIRLATYNVFWRNDSQDKHNSNSITRVIHDMDPDIIVLQEVYCFNKSRLEKHFHSSHPYQLFKHFHCSQLTHEDGLGILSKYPIVKHFYFPPQYGWFPGWLYVIKTPKGYIQVLNVHLNPKLVSENNIGLFAEGLWLTPRFRLQEISYYYNYLNPNLPTIIAGDFNENDSGAAASFLRNKCYCDLLLRTPPYLKTWHYKFGLFSLSGRYDRIYTTSNIKTLGCQILQKGYSDHFPVMMDFTK